MPKKKLKGKSAKGNGGHKQDKQIFLDHFDKTLTRIHREDEVKMMRVRPLHAMPFSHKQVYIRRNNSNKQCQADERYDIECHNPKCPCREYETLNREELKTMDNTVLQHREKFIQYLRNSYKDMFQHNILHGNKPLNKDSDLKTMVNALAEFVEWHAEFGEDWKCIRGFHALMPYIDLCQENTVITFITYSIRNPEDNPLVDMLVPMFKYWFLDEKFGIQLAAMTWHVLHHVLDVCGPIAPLLKFNLSHAIEYISPLGHSFGGSERIRDAILLFHAKILQESSDREETALAVKNIKIAKGKETYRMVAAAYSGGFVDSTIAGTYVDFIEQTGAPVEPNICAIRKERPHLCCPQALNLDIKSAQEKFDRRLDKLKTKEKSDPLWKVKRQMLMTKIDAFQERFEKFTLNPEKDTGTKNRQKSKRNGHCSSSFSSQNVSHDGSGSKKHQNSSSGHAMNVDHSKKTIPTKTNKNYKDVLTANNNTECSSWFSNDFPSDGQGEEERDEITETVKIGISSLEDKIPKDGHKKEAKLLDRDARSNYFYKPEPAELKMPGSSKSEQSKKKHSEQSKNSTTETDFLESSFSRERGRYEKTKKSDTAQANEEEKVIGSMMYEGKIYKISQNTKKPPSESIKISPPLTTSDNSSTSNTGPVLKHMSAIDKKGLSKVDGKSKETSAKQCAKGEIIPGSSEQGQGDSTRKCIRCGPGNNCGRCAPPQHNQADIFAGGDEGMSGAGDCGTTEQLRQMSMDESLGEVASETSKKDKKKIKIRICASCAKFSEEGEKFGKCSGCRKLAYCSKDCQRIHWKLAHRYSCNAT